MHAKPNLVGMASPVLEILPVFCMSSKRPKFPFGPWTIKKGTEPLQELLNKIRTE